MPSQLLIYKGNFACTVHMQGFKKLEYILVFVLDMDPAYCFINETRALILLVSLTSTEASPDCISALIRRYCYCLMWIINSGVKY